MVTGRYADSLIRVSGLKGIPVVGTHGFEARHLPGNIQFASPSLQRRFKKEAARLWKNLQILRKKFPGVHIERKPFSSTLHFRGLNLTPSQVRNLQADFTVLFRQAVTWKNWKLQGGKKMIEAMPKGFSKGKAVRKILEKHPHHFPLYAGDDIGDISVLKVLRGKGLRIAVGQRIPKRHCDLRFEKPGDFIKWLRKLG
jgi:trehalose 6-phosphate phosphatase